MSDAVIAAPTFSEDVMEAARERIRATHAERAAIVTLDQVATLNSAVVAHDAAVTTAREELAAIRLRRAALDDRLAALNVERPTPPMEHDASLIDMLVADPSAAPSMQDLALATERDTAYRAELGTWQTKVSLIERAGTRLDAEIADKAAAVRELETGRGVPWRAFVAGAHRHLMGRFMGALDELIAAVLDPIAALEREEEGGRALVNYDAPKIDNLSRLLVNSYVDEMTTPGLWYDGDTPRIESRRHQQQVYPRPQSLEGAIDAFRASLPAGAP